MRKPREIWVNIYDTDDESEFFVAYQSKEIAEENTPDHWVATKFIEVDSIGFECASDDDDS